MSDDLQLPFAPSDIFRGFTFEDSVRINALCHLADSLDPHHFIDAIGIRVDPSYCPWIADRIGTQAPLQLLPTDGYLADGIEYAALALALEWAAGKPSFVVGEIGAGWGPWITAAAVLARRRGFTTINMTALEADNERFEAMRRHLAINDLVPTDAPRRGSLEGLDWRLHCAAADWCDRPLYWPSTGGLSDAGMAAGYSPGETADYRGVATQYQAIDGIDLATAFDHVDTLDFLHLDIQGGEGDLLLNSLPFLNQKVSAFFAGTHNRKIEGDLIHTLRNSGWILIREKPCQFYTTANTPTLTGQTYVDGGQLWRRAT